MDKFIIHLPRGSKRSSDSSCSRKENSKVMPNKKTKQQMYIDLGQKSFGKTTTCPNCDFVYLIGDFEDEKQHKRHCSLKNNASVFCTAEKYSTIVRFDDDGKVVVASVKAFQTDKCLQVLASQMQKEFGSSIDSLFSEVDDALSVYVRVSDGRAVGCLIHEHIPTRYCVVFEKGNQLSDVDFANASYDKSCLSQATVRDDEFSLGIRYIWVHRDYRSKRVGSELVDAARKLTFFGSVVPKTNVAFSQPTESGLKFAFSYIKADSIMVYK